MEGISSSQVTPESTVEAPRKNKIWIIGGIVVIALLVLAVGGWKWAGGYYHEKGISDMQAGDYESAKSHLTRALICDAKNSLIHARLGRADLGPADPQGDIYFPRADYKEATRHIEQAISLGLKDENISLYASSLEHVAYYYWTLKEYTKATALYKEEIALAPDTSFWPRYLLASDYFLRSNKPEEALGYLISIRESARNPFETKNLYKPLTVAARIYASLKDFTNAETFAKLALESNPPSDALEAQIAHNILALSAGAKKDFVTAEKEVKTSNELSKMPDSQNCILAYAYYLGKEYNKAIAQAKNIPGKVAYVDTFCPRAAGRSYFDQKKTKEARQYLEEYMRLTASLEEKNAAVLRERDEVAKILEGL